VSADEPERIRGKQFRKFWFDELAACQYAQEAWDQVMFGFRLPDAELQGLITTTPKPIDVIKKLIANPRTVVTRGSSDENRANLSPDFIADVIDPYRGTRLGRQEIDAEILEDVPGALWTRAMMEACRVDSAPQYFVRIVVAIDPAVTSNADSDETGIGVVGLAQNGHAYVLQDLSLRGSPAEWAKVAIMALIKWGGDRIVAEVNNGGDLVAANIYGQNAAVPVRAVRASRGKFTRAEPAAALYERGLVHHAGRFPLLEDQLCGWSPLGGQKSPDRMDWLVWALYDLILQPAEEVFQAHYDSGYSISPI
jgi:phage terminase large subunit-like protein